METIGKQRLMSFLAGSASAEEATNNEIRRDLGHSVRSYLELATKIAELQFLNREYVLLFRGQGADYRNSQGATTLRPSLFTPVGKDSSKVPKQTVLQKRYEQLAIAENSLVSLYEHKKLLGIQRLRRQHILRWQSFSTMKSALHLYSM